MTLEIVFTKKASVTFDAIKLQIRERWGVNAEEKFNLKAYKILKTLSASPFIYQFADKELDIRKAFLHKNSSVFYKIKEKHIVILFFWDNRQDPIFK